MIVTDSHIARILTDQRVDVADWRFFKDYSIEHQTTKIYRNEKTGLYMAVCQGLPKVNADGIKICGDEPLQTRVGWQLEGGLYRAKPNIFTSSVDGIAVELNHLKQGVAWEPRVYLNGMEQHCGVPTMLSIDPTNPNYYSNVIEWDYGICRRRLRVIEGAILERWIFLENPNGEIRIKHNQSGDLRLVLGEHAISNDEELVSQKVFVKAKYPLEIGATLTVYPTAGAVDGWVRHLDAGGLTWTAIVGAVGTTAIDHLTDDYVIGISSDGVEPKWDHLTRAIYLYDESALGPNADVSAVTQSIRGESKVDALSITPDVNIYESAPANDNNLVAGDFNSLGTTAYCDTPVTYGNWSTVGYNNFVYNATGIAAAQAAREGILRTGAVNANYDIAEALDPGNHAPDWSDDVTSQLNGYYVEKGAGFQPKVVITYTIGVGGARFVPVGSGSSARSVGTGGANLILIGF